MSRPASLTAKEIRKYLLELEKKNLKLHDQIAKLQVQNVDLQNEIKALKKGQPKFVIQMSHPELEKMLKETEKP